MVECETVLWCGMCMLGGRGVTEEEDNGRRRGEHGSHGL